MDGVELEKRFTYHPPKDFQPQKYELIRQAGLTFARAINSLTPDSREQALALTKVEEAVMHANAAVARRT